MSNFRSNNLVPLCGLAALAAVVVWLATPFGIGVTSDSTVYINAADNLLHGRGVVTLTATGEVKPLNHYPPLYPAVLALVGLVGVSLETAARLLNSVLFAANVLLVGLAIRYCTSNSLYRFFYRR